MTKAAKTFEEELVEREAALETARAAKADDPEAWAKVSTDFAEWRRGLRELAGRPMGDPEVSTEEG